MKEYIFILGRDPELSLLELKAYLDSRGIKHELIDSSDKAALLKLPEIDFGAMIKDLGGTSKIGEVFEELGGANLFNTKSNKINYAISVYDDTHIDDLKNELKRKFKEERLKATIKNPGHEDDFLGPSEVVKHELLVKGFEIIAYNGAYAKTIAVFNPYEYESRDKSRPAQRPLEMVSIRLAKILINLSGAKPGMAVLDPFCGIGVILQEAMLMGIDSVGIDNDKEAVAASLKNTEWIRNMFNCTAKCKVVHGDSTKPLNIKADAVATEPFLGPLLRKIPMENEALKIANQLKPMYDSLLKSLRNSVKGRIAIVAPRFRLYSGKRIGVDFERLMKENGYKQAEILQDIKFPITYLGQRGIIEREIWVIEKDHKL